MVKKIKFFCSLQKKENKKQGRWSQEEQDRFLKGCYFFKNDWEKIKDKNVLIEPDQILEIESQRKFREKK